MSSWGGVSVFTAEAMKAESANEDTRSTAGHRLWLADLSESPLLAKAAPHFQTMLADTSDMSYFELSYRNVRDYWVVSTALSFDSFRNIPQADYISSIWQVFRASCDPSDLQFDLWWPTLPLSRESRWRHCVSKFPSL